MRVIEVLEYCDSTIIEYDIKSCNINVLRDLELINEQDFFRIGNLPKLDRQIDIGLQLRRDTDGSIYKSMKSRTDELVDEFLKANELDRDVDILSIVNDAVYSLVPCSETIIEGVEFVGKHKFTSAIRLSSSFMILFNSATEEVSIKGINDKNIHLHTEFIEIVKKIMKLKEMKNNEGLYNFIHTTIQEYMTRKLDINCYREFNAQGTFNMMFNDMFIIKLNEQPDNNDVHLININHNYDVLLKLRDLLLT